MEEETDDFWLGNDDLSPQLGDGTGHATLEKVAVRATNLFIFVSILILPSPFFFSSPFFNHASSIKSKPAYSLITVRPMPPAEGTSPYPFNPGIGFLLTHSSS